MKKEYAELSMRDAFKALKDISEDFDNAIRKQYGEKLNRRNSKLTEAVDVSINSSQEVETAQKELDDASKQADNTTLRVIDVDADTMEHLKDGKDYVGQLIAQCKVCRALRFLDVDKLKVSEEDPDVYNVEEECPHCHSEGKGYTVVGQVGKVESEEVKIENDAAPVEGEGVELTAEAEEATEETPTEETTTEEEDVEVEEEPEQPFDETSSADDTEDLDLPSLGDEIDSDETAADDTEEAEEEEIVEEELEEKEDIEEELQEPQYEACIKSKLESVDSLFECFTDGCALDNISCLGDDEQVVFRGCYSDMPQGLKNSKLAGFSTCGGNLIINIDLDCPGEVCLRDLLSLFTDDECEDVSLIDSICDKEVFHGCKGDAIDKFGECAVWSVEKPRALQCITSYDQETPWSKEDDDIDDTGLIHDIINKNGLKYGRVHNPKCPEYWIAESINNKEDLDVVFEEYVKCLDEETIGRFKSETGYMDAVDEAVVKELNETAARNDNVEETKKVAEEDLKAHNAYAVIYGYFARGKFFALPENIICDNDKELRLATEMVRNKYRVGGSIYTVYGNKNEALDDFSREDIEAEKVDIDYQTNLEELRNGVAAWAEDDYESGTIFSLDDKDLFDEYCKESFDTYNPDSHLDDLWDWYWKTVDEIRDEDNTEDEEEDIEVIDDDEEVEVIDDESDVDESLNESVTLNAKGKMLNDGADALDKALTSVGIEAQVITDDAQPTAIVVLVADQETKNKAKTVVVNTFKKMGWEPTVTEDIDEDGFVGIAYDKILLKQPIGAVVESVQYYRNRKELSEAIAELKNNNSPYVIKRTIKEGYRYAVIIGESITRELKESFNTTFIADNSAFKGTREQAEKLFDAFKAMAESEEGLTIKRLKEYLYDVAEGKTKYFDGCLDVNSVDQFCKDLIREMVFIDDSEEESLIYDSGKLIIRGGLSKRTKDAEEADAAEKERKRQERIAASLERAAESVRAQLNRFNLSDEDLQILLDNVKAIRLSHGDNDGKTKDYLINAYGKELFGNEFNKSTYRRTQWFPAGLVTFKRSGLDAVKDVLIRNGFEEYIPAFRGSSIARTALASYLIQNGAEATERVRGAAELAQADFEDEFAGFLAEAFNYNPDDEATDYLDAQADEYEERATQEAEFATELFDSDISEYLDSKSDNTIIYETIKGQVDKTGNIVLEGMMYSDKANKAVKFLLQPKVNESLDDNTTYIVTNNLSDEVFEFTAK